MSLFKVEFAFQEEVEYQKSDIEQLETMVGLSVLTSSERPQELAERFRKPELQSALGLRDQLASALRKHEAQRAQIKQLQNNQQNQRHLEQQLRIAQAQCLQVQNDAGNSQSQDEKLR